ncbi:MAG: hypothetical protein N2319_01335 [Candidatus Kapabacteria bacterium]|nr:hypothetical protein [Candidatus Kapabacteria bacterium]
MRDQIFFLVLCSFLSLFLTSCPEVNNPKDSTNNIKTGERQDLPSKTIATNGGIITFGDEAKEIKGMKINIPEGSYDQTKTFNVSFAKIESHNFGDRFKPISPLIKIANGGGYSERIMTLEIPAVISDKAVAAAFFYNDKTGTLEPIPVIRYSGGKVVIATRHFMSNGMQYSKFGKTNQPELLVDELYSHIVLSEVKEEDLQKSGLMSTGFEPGIDDWEFTNWGSIITPQGNCSGHSLSALWYFTTQKKINNKGIHHYFDKFDKEKKPDPFWQDNPKGIKFVSMVQSTNEKQWIKYFNDFYSSVRTIYADEPNFYEAYTREGIKAAAAQIYVTREPLYTIISTSSSEIKAHAIIAYAVDYANGKINVADPNFPGSKTRLIEFENGRFKPYISGDNANDPSSIQYNNFAFFGKSALFNWESIGYYWDETLSDNIGKNVFPKVEYFTKDSEGKEIELADIIMYESNKQLQIKCKIGSSNFSINDPYISLYKNDVELARSEKGKLELDYTLDEEDKNSDLGIWVWNLATNGYQNWIDYKWIKISELRIEPAKMNGLKNKEYSWKAIINNPPINARYEWNFGDKTPIVKVKNNTEVKHTYKDDGIFPIILELYDDSKNQLFAVATAYAIIGAGIIDTTYKFKFLGWYFADKQPTFEISIKGTVTANELRLINTISYVNFPSYTYNCKFPTEINVDLTISIKYTSGKVTKTYGEYYGLYKSEYEFEVMNKGFATTFDTTNAFKKMENYRCDTTGNIFKLKGTMKNFPVNGYGSLVLSFFSKSKVIDYYREGDGKEFTKEYYEEHQDMFFGLTIYFQK